MKKEEQKQKAREDWIRVYQQLGSVSKAALRCGIARSTLHRWIKRLPDEGLADRSRSPHRLARQKWDDDVINLILDIRDTYRYGKIRICSHLLQHYQVKISPSTVARVLEKFDMKLLKRYHKKKKFKRYTKEIPGERVQMDVCKIDTGIYQYSKEPSILGDSFYATLHKSFLHEKRLPKMDSLPLFKQCKPRSPSDSFYIIKEQ